MRDYFTSAMWLRIFLPELMPDADKVLYLDADTLAVDSLAPLWDTDLSGHALGAVTNVFQHNHVQRPAELGLSGPEVYFNSGRAADEPRRLARARRDAALMRGRERRPRLARPGRAEPRVSATGACRCIRAGTR